jgi:hypothetical protein
MSVFSWRWRITLLLVAMAMAVVACATAGETPPVEDVADASFGTLPGDAGAPEVKSCPSNICLDFRYDCNGEAGDGCEANIRSDVGNCGACGTVCALDGGAAPDFTRPACLDGGCAYQCITDPLFGPMRNCDGADPTMGDPLKGCPNAILCDPFNCGGCGIVAPLDPTGDRLCVNGNPLSACPSGLTNCKDGFCGEQCRNLNTDAKNCGACGRTCPDPALYPANVVDALDAKHITFSCNGPNPKGGLPECVAICKKSVKTLEIWKDCNGDLEATVADPFNAALNGCEINAYGNKDNCNECGTVCQQVCHTKKGTETTTLEQICDCPSGLTWCASNGLPPYPGDCVDLKNDPLHCGSCAGLCPGPFDGRYTVIGQTGPWDGGNGNPTCVDGTCGYKCKAGYADCNQTVNVSDGCEVDTQNFPKNCGACGRECLDNQRCGNGSCLTDDCAGKPTR